MRRYRFTAFVAVAAMLLSGCTSLSLNASDLLTPPQAAGNRAEIQSLIRADAGGNYSLLYPADGAYKSGVILYDADSDSTDEAFALYADAGGTPHALFAKQRGGAYQTIGSCQLSSANISRVSFADINADGEDELIISCDAGTPSATLTAYLVGGEVTPLYVAEGFTDYVTGDFDGNSAEDILVLHPASTEAAAAVLTVYADGAFSQKSSCEVDPAVVSYPKLSYGKLSEDVYGAAADGVLDSGAYTTQLLYYDASAHALVNPLFLYADYDETHRDSAVTCLDIDGDGMIELPLCSSAEHAESEDPATVCRMVRWSVYDAGRLSMLLKQEAVLCEDMGFMLRVKPELTGMVTARYTDVNTAALYFLTYVNSEPALGPALLTVKRYNKGDFDSGLTAEAVLYESNTDIYTYTLNGADSAGYTDDEVKNSFMLTDTLK